MFHLLFGNSHKEYQHDHRHNHHYHHNHQHHGDDHHRHHQDLGGCWKNRERGACHEREAPPVWLVTTGSTNFALVIIIIIMTTMIIMIITTMIIINLIMSVWDNWLNKNHCLIIVRY